jgi:hypothetical protein
MAEREKRAVPRIVLSGAARLQSLGTSAESNGEPVDAEVLDGSVRGMRLRSPLAMGAGQAVKVEIGDAMILGEVCYCAPGGDGVDRSYILGLVNKECLTGLASLQNLLSALEPEAEPKLQRSR